MTTPVKFEIAKLLKEKGFNQKSTDIGYNINGENSFDYTLDRINGIGIAAPTIAEVVMWLFEKHGIWIEVSCDTVLDEKDVDVDVFYFVIRKLKPVNILYSGDFVNLPTEAYEAAIEYTLKTLYYEIQTN